MITPVSQLRLLIIIVSILVLASGCTDSRDSFDTSSSAIYFTTSDDDKHVSIFEKSGTLVATSSEELIAAFDEYPELHELYIGENSLNDLDKSWVEEVYRRGILIVAINEPISVLGNAVNLRVDLPDIDFSYAPEGFIVVTAFQSLNEPTVSGTRGYYAVSDYFATVEEAVNMITHKGKEFHLPPERIKEN